MIIEIAKWTLIAFGIFFIFMGVVMFIKPKIARETLRKAGNTNLATWLYQNCLSTIGL